MVGYSATPLIKKLGIKENSRIIFINEPASLFLELGALPKGVKSKPKLAGEYDYIQYFAYSKTELEAFFKVVRKYLRKDGMLWVSWVGPSKVLSKIHADLSENVIREIGLENGMVDVKVAAIDDTWSGLKFVYRLKDR